MLKKIKIKNRIIQLKIIFIYICMWNIGKYVWYLQLKLYVEYVH